MGSSQPRTITAIEIGTTSFHSATAKIGPNGFELVNFLDEVTQLGHGVGPTNQLESSAIERGIVALQLMSQQVPIDNSQIRVVATSVLREPRNRHEFIGRAQNEAGVEIEVISGIEQARLVHIGVLNATGVGDQPLLVCDIGGGSTQVVIGVGDEILLSRSFKLGSVRLTERFFATTALHPGAVSSCRKFVRSTLATIQPEVEALGFDVVAGSSWIIATLAKLVFQHNGQQQPQSLNRFEISTADITTITKLLADATSVEARRTTFNLEQWEAETILAGAVILEGLAITFGIKKIIYSAYGLCHGLLIDAMNRENLFDAQDGMDPVLRSVYQLAERCDDHLEHSANVKRIALLLFDCMKKKLQLPELAKRYLEASALLANVGIVVSHSNHHMHSYYVIRNSELVGLTSREIELIALIARYHRKSAPRDSHPEFMLLNDQDKHLVRSLAGLLRIAIGLDRTQDGSVKTLTVDFQEEQVLILVKASAKADLELNLYASNQRRNLLGDILQTKVKIVAAP